MDEMKQKIEAVSYELMNVCAEKGLTVMEMFELASVFPRLIKEEISKMEQKTSFKVNSDQGNPT